jgi:hypothetical protein
MNRVFLNIQATVKKLPGSWYGNNKWPSNSTPTPSKKNSIDLPIPVTKKPLTF